MTTWTELAAQVAPSAKALSVIVTVSVGSFMAGIGAIVGFGNYANLPETVASVEDGQKLNEASISLLREEVVSIQTSFQSSIEEARRDRSNILCLVRLTVSGEPVSALEIQQRCPR